MMSHQETTGLYFASAGDDIKIWDSSKLQIVKHYNFHDGKVKDLSWSSDNTFLCSTSSGGDKILMTDCSPTTQEKAKVVAAHAVGEHQTCVRISISGRKLYSGGVDGNVCVWDRESGKARKIYKDSHSSPITCIALNASETHIASGSNKGDVIIRNLSSDIISRPDDVNGGQAVRGATFSPWKHSLLGMAMDDGSVHLWDTLQGKSYHNFTQIHNAAAMDLMFSPLNDLLLASVGLDKHLMVFDVKRHKYLNKVKADQPLTSLTFLTDGYSIFAGSSLGRIYQYDLRNFSSTVQTVQAHSSTIHRLALQNTIKVRKDRSSRSNKIDRSRMSEHSRDSESTGDENAEKKQKMSLAAEQTAVPSKRDGRGDYFERGKFVTSSTNSTPSDGADAKPVANGYHHSQKQEFGDLGGGIISPLREDVFGDITMTSVDGSILPLDPSLMRTTFSSSRDTFGSYCDDILSPVASHPNRRSKGLSAGTQIHSKTSPHPLRQSYNATRAEKTDSFPNLRNSAPAPSFKALTAKARAEATLKESPELNNIQEISSQNLTSLPPKSPNTPALRAGDVTQTQTSSTPLNAPMTSQAATSEASTQGGGETSGFQYQAEYLRNTVKEMVDDLGDDLRRQINGVLTAMVKLSMQQEEFFERKLNERICGVNEQILRECQSLREENERLKKRCF